MPSIQHFLVFMAIALTSVQLSSATPIAARAAVSVSACTTPSSPLTGEATELPQPSANLALKHVAIGSGVQNYTCKPGQAKPKAIGAMATLYDATTLAYTSLATLNTAPSQVVQQSLNSALIVDNPLSIPGVGSFPIIGSHYFTADGTPAFDLRAYREIVFVKKVAGIPAPKGAPKGPNREGSVDWLALSDDGKGLSVGLGQVYRVETAGGIPPENCSSVESDVVLSVQYSAQYWFYG